MTANPDQWKPVGDGAWVGSEPSGRFPVYTRGNAGEVYPEVFTPLSFSQASATGERAMRNALLHSGLIRPDELADVPLTTAIGSGVFGGYAYLNLSVQRTGAGRMPGGKPTDADVNYLGVGDPPPHQASASDRNLRASLAGLRYVWRTVNTAELPELGADQKRVDDYLASLGDPADASDAELRRSVTDVLIPLFGELFERHLIISFAAGLTVAVLSNLCERQLDDANLAVELLAGLGDVDSAAPSVALWDLGQLVAASDTVGGQFDQGVEGLLDRLRTDPAAAEFVTRFDEFLGEFGSRGPNEWDTAFNTWGTDPSLALVLVDRMRRAEESHDPRRQGARLRSEQAQLETETLARLRWPVRTIFSRTLRAARLYTQARERTKTTVIRAIHGGRLQARELDERLSARSGGSAGDLWFVVAEELDDYIADPTSFGPVIAQRRALHAELRRRVPPFFFAHEQPPLDQWELRDTAMEPVTAGEILTGLPGCPGLARGRARVVTDPSDPGDLSPGDVLIAPLTDPSWTPLFVPAEAVVVDVGAIMSHAVIVSRELGIPCAVSVTDATRRIPDGTLVEVDGAAGTVRVLDG